MEAIIQNQGLQHIVEKSLMYLDMKNINSFRLVNNDFKGITESPSFLRVLKVRKLASIIKGFLLSYDNFDYRYNSEGNLIDEENKFQNIALKNGDEWKNKLFKFLHDQSLDKVEVDHFKLLCKILNQNLYALLTSIRRSHNLKELQVVHKARLVQNFWSGILILDQIHHRMHNHIHDETTIANYYLLKLQIEDRIRLVKNSWSGILILD